MSDDENNMEDVKIELADAKEDPSQKQYVRTESIWNALPTLILLLGPVLFGVAINSLGNDYYIKKHFYYQDGLNTSEVSNNTTNQTFIDNFPAWIWSMGFLFPFGGLFGSILGSISVNKLGRKLPSLIFSIIILFGGVLKLFSKYSHIAVLFLGRFLDGLGTSGFMVTGVLLLFESLPNKIGKYSKPFVQIGINTGILLIGIILLNNLSGEDWNYSYGIVLSLVGIICIVILFHPESPRYVYASTKDKELTEKYLKKLRGSSYDPSEFDEIKKQEEESANVEQMTIMMLLKDRRFFLSNISLIFLHISQQLCGINAIVSFTPTILQSIGYKSPDVGSVIVILIGLLCSFIFAPLVGSKKRKILWLVGFISMFISTVGFVINNKYKGPPELSIFFLGSFMGMFQIGPGPVVWFISLEMYPVNAAGAAQGIASFFNWFANTIIFLTTPLLLNAINVDTLIIFAVIQFLVILYSFFFVVETYGRTFEDIQADYSRIQSRFISVEKK